MRRFFRNIALYAFHIGFVRPLLMWVIAVRYRKRNLVPKGPCLVVSNHNSHLDAGVLMTLFPLRRLPNVHPVAAADYFGKTWLKRTMAMLFMNAIPIERRPVAGKDPLSSIAVHLRNGESLIFFPEGSRGEAGVVARFRPGIGKLVREMPGLLVLPVFLSGPERIWPRGEVVPVPLNIDATVGRPRTYDSTWDARDIAEAVQHDVMALAPPPPPVPGPRPSPPIRVAICGLDEKARSRVFQELTRRLGPMGRTLGIGDPLIESDAEGTREVTGPIPLARGRAWFGLLARIFRTGGQFKGERFVKMIERAQIDEALGNDRSARFAVTDGSALVDLMAWAVADFYAGTFDESGINHMMQYLSAEKKIRMSNWWRFVRKAPEVWLVNTFNLANPPVPNVLVNLSTPVPQLLQQLRSRGEELEPHENEMMLERVQTGYSQIAEVLRKRRKVELIELDTSATDESAMLDAVEVACLRLLEQPTAENHHG